MKNIQKGGLTSLITESAKIDIEGPSQIELRKPTKEIHFDESYKEFAELFSPLTANQLTSQQQAEHIYQHASAIIRESYRNDISEIERIKLCKEADDYMRMVERLEGFNIHWFFFDKALNGFRAGYDYEAVISDLKKGLDLNPNNPILGLRSNSEIALAYERKKDFAQATKYSQKALSYTDSLTSENIESEIREIASIRNYHQQQLDYDQFLAKAQESAKENKYLEALENFELAGATAKKIAGRKLAETGLGYSEDREQLGYERFLTAQNEFLNYRTQLIKLLNEANSKESRPHPEPNNFEPSNLAKLHVYNIFRNHFFGSFDKSKIESLIKHSSFGTELEALNKAEEFEKNYKTLQLFGQVVLIIALASQYPRMLRQAFNGFRNVDNNQRLPNDTSQIQVEDVVKDIPNFLEKDGVRSIESAKEYVKGYARSLVEMVLNEKNLTEEEIKAFCAISYEEMRKILEVILDPEMTPLFISSHQSDQSTSEISAEFVSQVFEEIFQRDFSDEETELKELLTSTYESFYCHSMIEVNQTFKARNHIFNTVYTDIEKSQDHIDLDTMTKLREVFIESTKEQLLFIKEKSDSKIITSLLDEMITNIQFKNEGTITSSAPKTVVVNAELSDGLKSQDKARSS